MKRILGSMWLLLVIANVGFAQSPFQNLDFETFVPLSPSEPFFGTLPGWGRSSFITHAGLNSRNYLTNDFALAGDISIILETGYVTDPNNGELLDPLMPEAPGISQTGVVPDNSRSIRLLADTDPVRDFNTIWAVTLGGSQIALMEISPGEFGGDFSPSLAGTTQTLSIRMIPPDGDEPVFNLATFDNISFSAQAVSSVPEPSSTLVLIAGLLGLASQRRKKPLLSQR